MFAVIQNNLPSQLAETKTTQPKAMPLPLTDSRRNILIHTYEVENVDIRERLTFIQVINLI